MSEIAAALSGDPLSAAARPGLVRLSSILDSYAAAGDEAGSWSPAQLCAAANAARILVSRWALDDYVDPVMVAIVERALDFGFAYLERELFDGEEFGVQTAVLQLIGCILCNETFKEVGAPEMCTINEIVDQLSCVEIRDGRLNLKIKHRCFLQGFNCLNDTNNEEKFLASLSSECLQSDIEDFQFGSLKLASPQLIISIAQHIAVVHLKCVPRLLRICRILLQPPPLLELESINFNLRLLLVRRFLRILGALAEEYPYSGDTELLQSFVSCMDCLPSLFGLKFDFCNNDLIMHGDGTGHLLLQILDGFKAFLKIVFGGSGAYNIILASIIASLMEVLNSKVWRYDQLSISFRPPLIYSPQVVQHLVKFLESLREPNTHSVRGFKMDMYDKSEDNVGITTSYGRSVKIFLHKIYTSEECFKLIFPASEQWIDDLVHLVVFLHREGLKSITFGERPHLTSTKSTVSDMDSTVSHEDEAIFGDLFSEATRTVGSTDSIDHPVSVVGCSINDQNLSIQVAANLICFLKTSIFSPEWCHSIYADACAKLQDSHIMQLLSMLNCKVYLAGERNFKHPSARDLQNASFQTYDACFELLQMLLGYSELQASIRENIVEQVFSVENGAYVYNIYTLSLVAHAIIKGANINSNLSMKILDQYVNFLLDKESIVSSSHLEFTDFCATLPCTFHLDILLMAFHLSTKVEKAKMAKLVYSSLKKMTISMAGVDASKRCRQGLVLSRLFLVLRHMLLYPLAAPSWLILRLRLKLREIPRKVQESRLLNDYLPSLASIVTESIFGDLVKESPALAGLLPHLIDVAIQHGPLQCSGMALESLDLELDDLVATFCEILDSLRGKIPELVEHLVVERYLSLLCWSTLSSITCGHDDSQLWANRIPVNPDFLDGRVLTKFALSLSSISPHTSNDIAVSALGLLKQLNYALLHGVIVPEGLDITRASAWLSLLLSVLNATGGAGFIRTESSMLEQSYSYEKSARKDSLMDSLSGKKDARPLLYLFASFLKTYLRIYQKAYVALLDRGSYSVDRFFSSLLLKHSAFDKSRQDILLQKSNCDAAMLDFIFNLLPELDKVSTKVSKGLQNELLVKCFLHGFPSYYNSKTGTLLSCILVVKEIICALHGYLKLVGPLDGIEMDRDATSSLLDMVMAVKSDQVFTSLDEICGAVFTSLANERKDASDYEDILMLKNLEDLLADIYSKEGVDSDIQEVAVTKYFDLLEALRKSKVDVLKFYLGSAEGVAEEVKSLFASKCSNVDVLIDALDHCFTEAVSTRVLNLYADLLADGMCPDLREKLQHKYLKMELSALSLWLESRILGCPGNLGSATAPACSLTLREKVLDFLIRLIHPSCDALARELQHHLFDSMLLLLDQAFLLCDLPTAKAFFYFMVELLDGSSSAKQLFEKTVILMEKLADKSSSYQGLKFLFTFVNAAFGDSGSYRRLSKCSPKSSINNLAAGPVMKKHVVSRSNLDTLVLSTNRESRSPAVDCDGISGEEDEDDETSDGELGSVDRDNEDGGNSERALASKVCTFTSSGSNFMEQHWYFCYTCDLTVSKGCCSVCAKVCHKGHRVVYSRSSRFFCDCGAGGVRGSTCQCLKPRKFIRSANAPPSSNFHHMLSIVEDKDQMVDSSSDCDDDLETETDSCFQLSFTGQLSDDLPTLVKNLDVEGRIINICQNLIPTLISHKESNILKDRKVLLGSDKKMSYVSDIFQSKKSFKSGSLDLKIKADYPNSRELKSHLSNGSLAKSLLSVSVRGKLAVGEGDKVSIFDIGQLIGQPTLTPVTADKTNLKPLSRNIVRFEIVHVAFNPLVETYLAVAGYEECQVLTLNSRGEVTDRLAIELALQGAYIRQLAWFPGSQVQLMVVTSMFVKIYDLSLDNISPLHYFTLSDDLIVDATLVPASMGKVFLLVLSESGLVYRLEVSVEGEVGAKSLSDTIALRDGAFLQKGMSLCFSSTYRLLLLSYEDGSTLIGRLDSDSTTLEDTSFVYEEDQDGKTRAAGLHHWQELCIGSGILTCVSSLKSNSAISVSFGPHDVVAQNMRHGVGSSVPMVGVAAYKSPSKDSSHYFLLYEDGSLHIFSHALSGGDAAASSGLEHTKKLGSSILTSKAYAGVHPEFPLDFFENTICITSDVKVSCDVIKNGDSESIKQRLASEDGFLEGSSSAGYKVTVMNSNTDIVMVGCRISVGNTSSSSIPSEVTIFNRVIKLDEGMRSWYDVPFTTAESLLADEEFSLCVGRTFDGLSNPRIDSLEVYGQAKDDFGWKEKMDAVLDMEAQVLSGNSSSGSSLKKIQTMQPSSVQEQLLADALKTLARIYILCGTSDCSDIAVADMELNKIKSKVLLEMVFQSDKELLRSAASNVLQALFPRREVYYHVKDMMRLSGMVKFIPSIMSRIGSGGAASNWVIKEFTMYIHALSKIASHRKANMGAFLKTNGSQIIDGLMQVFWEILDLDRPETLTINNIVIPCVELIYHYAECLSLQLNRDEASVAPAVNLLKKLLFAPYVPVQTSSSLAIASRLLQVPFPKQTMIAADEIADTLSRTGGPGLKSMGGNAHVMIEEDPATSSVQYCCDGCSVVPIVRQRWHCTVCPDFDLCETCYEVLDGDTLALPHTKDHPMTAIPIEMDSLGADGNEGHLSIDDINDSTALQVSADRSMQNSPSSFHALETNDAAEFPDTLANQPVVSISASKRAVNSLLIRCLIRELGGWMDTTSGSRAIPVMQLFYRLSSAVGGPFMIDYSVPESLDLEKFVSWLLDQINVNKPFSAKSRCSFGEVLILLFMFFTLMLRNWHQPGGEGAPSKPCANSDTQGKGLEVTPQSLSVQSSRLVQEKLEFASQLVRACSILRQQAFVNYLMDIIQQLVHVFKSSSVNTEIGSLLGSGCGSLLTVRRELPSGNFAPFFSDSYAKLHPNDLFVDYHKLLLENTFRLLYSMVRPEKSEKAGDKDKILKSSASKDLKLDGYQDVLCSYISNPHTSFVRRYARRLLLHLCGGKTQYYSIRDSWQYAYEVKKLHKIINKSGGFRNPVPYERSVKLIKCLSALCDVAGARPRNWQKFCLKHNDLVPFLMGCLYYFNEECVVQTLKLFNLAFFTGKEVNHAAQKPDSVDAGSYNRGNLSSSDSKKKRKSEDGSESNSEKTCMDMEQVAEIFNDKDCIVLRRFVDTLLLECNLAMVRHEAKCVLYGVWYHAKNSCKEIILTFLLNKVEQLPMYGQNLVEYTDLMTWLLGKAVESNMKHYDKELVNKCLTTDVIACLYKTLHSQNELLANHPNSFIYNTLSCLVEFDGYYLESEPCVTCSCPDLPYTRMKLESLKSETKFTDNRIIVKCTGSYTIQTVTMNVHDARKSKSVKVLNLYYNNRPVTDLSELKNNWSLWKRAKSCHLAFNQTELKVEFSIPITACNFMIELDSFYENLQASSLESLQCPRCSRSVTDKHGICSNCHENAYQCRQCRNINYENLDSFLCNECGYSKYGRFEFHFMAKPSFSFDNMENDDDMRKGLAAIESESENAHRRYQQLLGFKKPLIKLVSSIGETEIDSQQKDAVQQMMVSLPGPTGKVNRKIALLGMLYGEKCKAAFDSVSKSVQTLQGLRRVLMIYLHQKSSDGADSLSAISVSRSPNNCYGCATTFVTQCLELLQVLSKHAGCKKQLIVTGILAELFENNIHQGPRTARTLARSVLSAFSEGDADAVQELNRLIKKKVMYCLEHHRSMDIAVATREELLLLSETCALVDEFWEARLRVAFQLLFSSIKAGAKHPAISEHVILPCLRIISQVCTPPKSDVAEMEPGSGKSTPALQTKNDEALSHPSNLSNLSTAKVQSEGSEKIVTLNRKSQDIPLLSYFEWENGASYLDFVRRQYKVSQVLKSSSHRVRQDSQRCDYLALKYGLRWKRRACRRSAKSDLSKFALGSWVSELILSACSQSIRSEICTLMNLLCPLNSSRHYQLLNLLMSLLPGTLLAGESAAEYFELFSSMVDLEGARLFLTARGCLSTICSLITAEVCNVESQERSLSIDISQGFILHKLIELLNKFLEVKNVRARFMRDELLAEVLEAFLIIRGLVVQKTKLISDCTRLLKEILDSLLLENSENKRQFIRACIAGLQKHAKERKRRTSLFILEQLCNLICPVKPESVYLLVLNKSHTQEEFIRGSMTKNPYSSSEIGPLMRDVKNKICTQLDLVGLLEDDYSMELLVAGNIISLDLSISQVFEQVWKKHHVQSHNLSNNGVPSSAAPVPLKDCPPMTVTYRLQGLDGEATEPMIKELEEETSESLDPEVEFAIAGAVRECGGLEVILNMIQRLRDDELRSNHEELSSVLDLLNYCCKIRENRRALLRLGALGLLLEIARRAFSVDAMEPAEGILLIVESLTVEANESDISITESVRSANTEESGAGEQAKKIVRMFLERMCDSLEVKKSNKQQRNDEMVARILPSLTYGEREAMEVLVQHFEPFLNDWGQFDAAQKPQEENPNDQKLFQKAAVQRSAVENFVRVSESLKTSSCGDGLKDIILDKGITKAAVRHLREAFTVAGQTGFRSSVEWSYALKLPSVPLILSMLRGLSKGHLATQKCIDDEGILPLLHALEGVPGENEIGARAENLLDTLANKENNGDGFLEEKVRELRHATREEMRRRAQKKRELLLQGLGMRQEFGSDGGKRIVVAQPFIEGLEDVEEEEDGVACMVCREGYTLRPTDMLGVYSFSKRVSLGAQSSGSGRGDCVYTTVSHFNIIHFQCHQEAKRADAALKNPKKEWEGATLRNNETLCNCIFPLRGPSVPLVQYARCVDLYWENLNALGRADGSRLRLLTYDIVLMLARFAMGASFSNDSRGGGKESNSRFLPFMIQMASYLVEQGNANQQRQAMAKAVSTYLSNPTPAPETANRSPSRGSASSSEETIQFMMVYSLLSESYERWLEHRPAFLQRGIHHAYMQHKHGPSTLKSDEGASDWGDGTKLFALVKPMLLYIGLIQQLQKFFKASTAKPSGGASSSNLEKWDAVMKEKLVNMKEMTVFSRELLSWLEKMNASTDLQEAFNVMETQADISSCGYTYCEDFVRAAIAAGKC